jgi:hypothetical protein
MRRSRCSSIAINVLLPAIAAGLLFSCGGGSDAVTDPQPRVESVASLELSETSVSVEMGFTHHISAVAKSPAGSPLDGYPVQWASDDPNVATVTGGNITAIGVGTTTIRAIAGEKVATASVAVVPTVVVQLRLSRVSATLAPGKTLQLTAEPLDALGRVIKGRTVTFSSSDDVVVHVGSAGLISAELPGSATITALADGKIATCQLAVLSPTLVSIEVRASAPSGFPSLNRYEVKIRHEDDSLAIEVPEGATSVLTGSMTLPENVQVVASSNANAFWTSRLTISGPMPASIPIVFIPQFITLSSGTHSGATVPTHMTAATTPCQLVSNQCLNGFYPRAFRTGVQRWPTFPVPVSTGPFGGADSIAIWDALHAMEASVGRQLFIPATASDLNLIRVAAGLPPGIVGNFSGYARWQWDSFDRITGATVWFVSMSSSSRNLIQHEFVHALGFQHTCAWGSVMGGYGCSQAALGATDAAHILLASAIFDAEATYRSPSGTLPCAAMSIWAASQGDVVTATCADQFLQIRSAQVASRGGTTFPYGQDSAP